MTATITEVPPAPARIRAVNDEYTYPPTGQALTRVTKILGATDAKQEFLIPWASAITARRAVADLTALRVIIRREGDEAAIKYLKEESERIRNIRRDAGTYVHDVVERLVLWAASPDRFAAAITLPDLPDHLVGVDYDEDEPLDEVVAAMVDGFTNFISDYAPDIEASEMTVFWPEMGIAGTLDLIIVLRGYAIGRSGRLIACPGNVLVLCVDIKTGKHMDVTWQEQVACYRRMPECLLPLGQLAPLPRTDAAAVLHLRPEHERGYRLHLVAAKDDALAWNRFKRAADIYHGRRAAKSKPGKVCYPLRPDGTMPPPRIADLDGEGYGHAITPLVRAGVRDLDDLAAMTASQCLAIKRIGPASLKEIRAMLADNGRVLRGEELLPVLDAVRETAGPEMSDHTGKVA